MKTVCRKVNGRSAKTNIRFDGARIAKVKLFQDERPDYFLRTISNTFWLSMQR